MKKNIYIYVLKSIHVSPAYKHLIQMGGSRFQVKPTAPSGNSLMYSLGTKSSLHDKIWPNFTLGWRWWFLHGKSENIAVSPSYS